jgi:hypothetical protein
VYSQHEFYFNQVAIPNRHRNPRAAFFEDLNSSIVEWMAAGEQIILGLDANEDIHSNAIQEWTRAWGLIDGLKQTHPNLDRVATCNKNSNNVPIDGIWISPSLHLQGAGMTGFGELYPDSDHRILWVDIHLESLFGFHSPLPARRPTDSLPIRDPRAMQKYNRYVKSQFKQHRITEKTFRLEGKAMQQQFTEEDAQEYNKIQQIQQDIRRRARKHCRRFYTSKILFTDELGIIYRKRKLWKMMEQKRLGLKVDIRTIRRLMVQVQEHTAFQLSVPEIKMKQQEAITSWKAHKKRHRELRDNFELAIDKRRATKFGTSVEAQTKQRRNAGSTKLIFQKIKNVMKPREHISISTVEFTDPEGRTVECLSRDAIEQACVGEGQRRFTQASDTPFLQGSLLRTFGYNANQHAAQAVLDGTFQPAQDVSHYTCNFLKELTMPDSIRTLPSISGTVSTEDHCNSWRRMNIRTGSSPYGPLFCDYMAGAQDPEVAAVDASLSSIPYMTGFSPTIWQKASDVMIPKKKSSRHVQKLRIIVLFDAMFNMINKRIAREMILRAQTLKLLPDEAYGGVPGRRATTCSLNKILALDIIRMERRMATLCSNDAKSCYDRIVHTVASLCMQRLGVSEATCFTIFNTLQTLQHHVRTAFGERPTGYGAAHIPLHGVGQGNGAGPAIWLAITIPLINMLRKAGFGLKVQSPFSHDDSTMSCFVYVDDADSIHSPLPQDTRTVSDIIADMQRMLDTWSGALHATGGMIESSKSYWYLIAFKWNKRKLRWEYRSIADTPATIYLRHPGMPRVALARKEVHDADPDGTLGTFIAMDGNQRLVVESLKTKVNAWADKIRSRQLTATEGWLSCRTGITMSLKHQLYTSRLTRQECKQITQQLKIAALRASKLPITYPDVLVYSPKEFLGLGLPNLWHIQATLWVEQCLQFANQRHNPTGILLRTVIENMRIELGVSRCPLEYPFHRWNKCATPTQFFPFWEYATETSLLLRDGVPALSVARKHDVFLMEALEQNGYSPTQLRILNLCRIHLRVYLLSDMTTGDGRKLDKFLLHRKIPFEHHNRYRWPPVGCLNNHSWNMWQEALIQCFTLDHHQYPYQLRQPLGAWTSQQLYAATYFSAQTNMIYHKEGISSYRRFLHTGMRQTRHPTYARTSASTCLPPDAVPTTTVGNFHLIRHTGTAPHIPTTPASPATWWGIVTTATLPIQDLIRAIHDGTAIAVTDGSYKDGMGTAAFTFRTTLADTREITLVHMTPGYPHDMTPYRAEMGGLFGIASFLHRLYHTHNLEAGQITVACDCKSALEKATSSKFPHPKSPDFDLLTDIYHMRQNTRVTWVPKWVRGHQDNHQRHEHLDAWARININMDNTAKQHWEKLQNRRPAPFSLPTMPGVWSLWSKDQRVTTWTTKSADQLHYNPSARTYWSQKFTHFEELDLAAIQLAYKSLNLYYQLRVPKWIGRRLPVGSRTHTWAPTNTSQCPRCGTGNETHLHVISCQHPGAIAIQTAWLDKLELWLARECTHPDLRHGVISLLRATSRSLPWVPPNSSEPSIQDAFRQQQRLGTDDIPYGWWANGWAEAQNSYLVSLSRRTTGQRWLSRLIKKQWEVSWDMWRHRLEVATTPDSFSLATAHEQLNTEIRALFLRLSNTSYAPLQRWFRQPLALLLQQPLAFKQDWIAMVRSFNEDILPAG